MAKCKSGTSKSPPASQLPADPFPLVGVRDKPSSRARILVEQSREALEAETSRQRLALLAEWRREAQKLLQRDGGMDLPAEDVARACALADEWARGCPIHMPPENARRVVLDLAASWPNWSPEPDPEDLEAALERAFDPERTRREALQRFRFPPDYWMPVELAAQWQTDLYPKENTAEAYRQWGEALRRDHATYLAAGQPAQARKLREQWEADERLLKAVPTQLPTESGHWISIGEANKLSAELGHEIAIKRISKLAYKQPPPFPSRPSRRGGKTKREVERQLFIDYVLTEKRRHASPAGVDGITDDKASERIKEAQANKRRLILDYSPPPPKTP